MTSRSGTESARKRIALIGARGHTGAELVKLIDAHPHVELALASSRAAVGKKLSEIVPDVRRAEHRALTVVDIAPGELVKQGKGAVDVVILALPNGEAARWVQEIPRDVVVVDLSADFRFDDTWVYGLPELTRDGARRAQLRTAKRISNPGCYATGAQLALAPLVEAKLLASAPGCAPHVFGVSGYSGAGTTPSPRNDPVQLRDNLMPYALVDHTHEREVSRHLGNVDVFFTPHVAPFFRGITLTVSAPLARAVPLDEVRALYRARYAGEALVRIVDDIPLVRDAALRHDVTLGGFAVDPKGRRAVVVATLDNLLKGAATQAIQNVNLALGYDELAGIDVPSRGTT